ncbi:MAG: alpha/beta hydrolase, partial [Candidatus Hydrogenedentota bacterium]
MLARLTAVCTLVAAHCLVSAHATIANYQWHLQRTLSGEGSTAVDCQRAIYEFLLKSVQLPNGTFVNGTSVSANKSALPISPEILDASVLKAESVSISTAGSGPVTIHVPSPGEGKTVSVYRRLDSTLFVRIPARVSPLKGYRVFDVVYPGEYVVAEERDAPASNASLSRGFFDFSPVSPEPEAKSAWELYPMAPEEVSGRVPLVLIHGLGNDRWDDFVHWAQHSDEAALLREHFQIWNFRHPMVGVSAPIGFSGAYPAFSESVVAYLARFIADAEKNGVVADGERRFFPEGPYAMLTHSQGGIKARALLVNYPEHAERVFAVVTLNCPHMGSPWAIPEWVRHTFSKIGLTRQFIGTKILQGSLADLVLNGYFNVQRQSDLDVGWANYDKRGGFGIPTQTFNAWSWSDGLKQITLSPRDANQTYARELPGITDETFEPPVLFDTYCGGLDCITPSEQGGMHLDKFFVYAGYVVILDDFTRALRGLPPHDYPNPSMSNGALRLVQLIMGTVKSAGSTYPIGTYRVGDGFVPLQSQLMLDGAEGTLLYKTRSVGEWEIPVVPTELREDVIQAHTLALPERLRLLRGWTHLDTITGRYDPNTGHSELFEQ